MVIVRDAESSHRVPSAASNKKIRDMKTPVYKILYVQVLFAIVVGVLLGHFDSELAVKMKPLGDGFVALIRMIIAPIIF